MDCSLVSCHRHSPHLMSHSSKGAQCALHEAASCGEHHLTPQRERVKHHVSDMLASLAQEKRHAVSSTQSHHHVVSLAVIVIRLMLKCMQTSKDQNPDPYSDLVVLFPAIFLILVMFTFCEHLVISFDNCESALSISISLCQAQGSGSLKTLLAHTP